MLQLPNGKDKLRGVSKGCDGEDEASTGWGIERMEVKVEDDIERMEAWVEGDVGRMEAWAKDDIERMNLGWMKTVGSSGSRRGIEV